MDLVTTLLDENKSLDHLLVSNDLDWARSIYDNVHWAKYNAKEKQYVIYDEERFKEDYGYSPKNNAVKIYKAFRGDRSDNIAVGVPRIREELLIKLVNEFQEDTIQDIIRSIKSLSYLSELWKEKILENKSRLSLNYKLVDFQKISAKELDDFIFPSSFNEVELRFLYKSLGFNAGLIDPRLEDKNSKDSFFKHRRIERA
jgi:5'-3' exonuclease